MVWNYTSRVWDRAKWRAERDKFTPKVPQGACSKVSMGDELDKFHKDFVKGPDKAAEALNRLSGKLDTYIAAVKKDHKGWTDRLDQRLKYYIDAEIQDIQKIHDARDLFKKGVQVVERVWPKLKTEALLHLTNSDDEEFKDPNLKALITGLNAIDVQGVRLQYVSDEVDQSITKDAKRYWYAADGGRKIDLTWINGVDDLVKRLPKLG